MTLLYARFPAMVDTSDGSHFNRAAVVVVDGQARLAVQMPRQHHEPGTVQVVATLDDVSLGPQERRKVVLVAADGQSWTVGVGDGCACRSSLQQWYADQIAGQRMGT